MTMPVRSEIEESIRLQFSRETKKYGPKDAVKRLIYRYAATKGLMDGLGFTSGDEKRYLEVAEALKAVRT